MPLFARQGRSRWLTLLGGLTCAAASFGILHWALTHSPSLPAFVLSRVLHGIATATITGASSAISAAVSTADGAPATSTWVSPAFLRNTAWSLAPVFAGYLLGSSDGFDSVLFLAYAIIGVVALFILSVGLFASPLPAGAIIEPEETPIVEQVGRAYGTVSSRGGFRSGYGSISSTRTASSAGNSRRSRRSSIDSEFSIFEDGPVFGIRMFTALYGYLAVGLVTAALQSVVPLFLERQLKWAISGVGFAFLSMSFPALVVGFVSRFLAVRAPGSARYTTALGFLITVPALLYLGHVREGATSAEQTVLFLILGTVSLGLGLSAEPLEKEIVRLMDETEKVPVGFTYLSATLTVPAITYAWGTLIGPLFAGGTHWVSGWHAMAKSLGVLSAFSALFTLVFIQGWIGNPRPLTTPRFTGPGTDEESAPLLQPVQNDMSHATPIVRGDGTRSLRKADYLERSTTFTTTDGSDGDLCSSVQTDLPGRHRRHFSIDNFSIATTAVDGRGGGQSDADGQQVRFQAALETPASLGSSFKQQLGNPERRFVMREAPHAPATDPLLASGSRYVIDEAGADGERYKRHVVVFEEGTVPAELLERRQHHVVAINSTDGSVKLAPTTENHAVHVTEEDVPDQFQLPDSSRRYVVVLLEKGDLEGGNESA